MQHFLDKHYDWQTEEIAFVYDELPLWAARPGQLLLNNLPLAPSIKALDIGFGTGFPLLHLAQRLGPSSKIYGIDLWKKALEKARRKIEIMGLTNIEILEGDAIDIPLPDQEIDLICSNLGLTNFAQPQQVVKECKRLLKSGGQLAISSNLVGTFQEFYDCFLATAKSLQAPKIENEIWKNIHSRSTVDSIHQLLTSQGFTINKTVEEVYTMRYLNGSAFLNDYFIIMGFLPSWKSAVPEAEQLTFFTELEKRLNEYASEHGALVLQVPIAYVEATNL